MGDCVTKKIVSKMAELLLGGNLEVNVGSTVRDASSANWNAGTNPAFVPGPRKITDKLDRAGRSQDVSDAGLFLDSSPIRSTRSLAVVPIRIVAVFLKAYAFFTTDIYTKYV